MLINNTTNKDLTISSKNMINLTIDSDNVT